MIKGKVLIISDNSFLCAEFLKIIRNEIYKDYSFDFGISPYTDSKEFNFKVYVYDLKVESAVNSIIENYSLVISLHCKQLFPKQLIDSVKCINVHPGYNPINRGWFPQVFAIIKDLPIGVTIHEIDEELDNGPIIVREFVEKYNYDTSETLYNRILNKEIEVLKKHLFEILSNKYSVFYPEKKGNLFLKKDFNDLLELDLDKEYKAEEFINIIRALTFKKYNNLFYRDKQSGKKIYISINIKNEE
jgi:methionyl-tRNA formyltransferase